MRCSVSRSLVEAAADVPWPGPDRRQWRQTLLAPLKSATPVPSDPSVLRFDISRVANAVRARRASEQAARALVPPLSPSLRAAARAEGGPLRTEEVQNGLSAW